MSTTDLCPLCGAPNDCGVAAGASTCWCFSAEVPADVIERVPTEQRGQACVCRACASRNARPEGSSSVPPADPA